MKNIFLFAMAFGLLGCGLNVPVFADEPDEAVAPENPLKAGEFEAQKAVAKVKTFNGRANSKADYYIYLQSASWCGPCQSEMPEIAKAYSKMKRANVELILISADKDKAAAKAFVKSHKAKFPVVMPTDKNVDGLVGYSKAGGIPSATIVDKAGKKITSGHGSIVKDWAKYCPKPEKD